MDRYTDKTEEKPRQLFLKKIVIDLGFINEEHFNQFKSDAINGIILFGSNFLEGLATALDHSEDMDSIKLICAFRQEFEQAALVYKMHVARQKAKLIVARQKAKLIPE